MSQRGATANFQNTADFDGQCFNCGGMGHSQQRCPSKPGLGAGLRSRGADPQGKVQHPARGGFSNGFESGDITSQFRGNSQRRQVYLTQVSTKK